MLIIIFLMINNNLGTITDSVNTHFNNNKLIKI